MKLLIFSYPLFTSLSLLFFGRYIGYKGSKFLSSFSSFLSFFIILFSLSHISFPFSLLGLFDFFPSFSLGSGPSVVFLKPWFSSPNGSPILFELLFDRASYIMLFLISLVSLLIIHYSM